jgi:hypothetical protein
MRVTVLHRADAKRMGKDAGRVKVDVVSLCPTREIQSGQLTDPLSDFMIGAGRVTADPEPTDNLALIVEGDTAPERNDPTGDQSLPTAAPTCWGEQVGVEGIRVVQAEERMAGQGECIQKCR